MHSTESKHRPPAAFVSLWWLHPFWIVAVPLLVFSLIAYLLPEPDYRENWRTAKAFGSSDLLLCVAVAAAFSTGCLLASWIDSGFTIHRRLAPGPRDVGVGQRALKILFDVAFIVTIAGYAIWFGSIFLQAGIGVFTNMLTGGGNSDALKTAGKDSMITGVTTVTQFGMGVALLGTYLGFTQGWRKVRLRLVLLLGLTALRAVFLSERLSLIEVVLPSLVLLIRLVGCGRPETWLRRFLAVAPIAGGICLYALFTFTEYFRSWSSFYSERGDQSLLLFSLLRLAGYYVTALNNGAVAWHAFGAAYFPYITLDWLWKFPVVGNTLKQGLGGTSDPLENLMLVLKEDANPEFNNPSGIFVLFTDFGLAGGLFVFALYGCAAGLLYGSWRRGSMTGMMLYSFLFVGMSEQVRICYLTEGRVFPTWLLLLVVIFITRAGLRKARSVRKQAAPAHPIANRPDLPPDPKLG